MSPLVAAVLMFSVVAVLPALGGLFRSWKPANARRLLARGALLVDAGTPEEFAADHLAGALNIPSYDLPRRQSDLGEHTMQIVIYSRGHVASAVAVQTLRGIGFHHVFNIGTLAEAKRSGISGRPRDGLTSAPAAEFRNPTSTSDLLVDVVDDASSASFPASDPPAWIGMHAGPGSSSAR